MVQEQPKANPEEDEKSYEYSGVPEERAWFVSRLFFAWERPLFRRANRLHRKGKALEQDDLLPLPRMDLGDIIGPKFEEAWNKRAGGDKPTVKKLDDLKGDNEQSTIRLRQSLLDIMGPRFYIAGLIKLLNSSLQFCFPLLLNAILKFIEETQSGAIEPTAPWYDLYRGYWLSAILLLAMGSKAVTENAYFHSIIRCGFQAKTAISVAVYNKSLRLTNAERQTTTLGELVNLMQVDASKIEMFFPQIHVLWDGMFQIVGYMTILYSLIGWPCFAGLVIMIFAGPVQGVVMKKLFGLNRKMVKHTDARVEATNEALQGIQSVKMQTWEEEIMSRITGKRSEELKYLREAAYLRGFSRAYMSALPGLVAVCSFVVYALWGPSSDISPATLFSALVAFDQLRFPLMFYPMALAQLVQAKVSAARVEVFLGLKEIAHGEALGGGTYVREEDADAKGEIIVQDAEVYWSDPDIPLESEPDKSDDDSSTAATSKDLSEKNAGSEDLESESQGPVYPKPALKGVSLQVRHGELCAVVGRVASGKSTLCAAVLNETFLKSGSISLKGSVAYAAQSPWILNATVRENILFGKPMDEERYRKVLKVCQLEHDLAMLEDGDLTDIGERGINLSGGQKARVSVARAAYSDAETILFDDPLSALDPEVAKQLFMDCIVQFMKGKTRLLVTNQIQFLSSCDTVVALRKGDVIETGTYADLIADEKSEVNRLLAKSSMGKSKRDIGAKERETGTEKKPEHAPGPMINKEKKALVTKEERNIGAVSLSVYLKYMKAGGGFVKFALVYLGFVLSVGNGLATSSWISYWTTDPNYDKHSEAFYLGIYFMLAVTLGIVTFIRAFLLSTFGVNASETLHTNLLNSVLRAPQSFFDTTPLGRILSRFSKDIYSIDLELADMLDFFLFCTLQVLTSLGTILFVTPWFGVAVIPLGFVYFRILNFFRAVSRETKRLDSIARSPVFAHFSETLGGLSTIRAFGQSDRFKEEFEGKVNCNTRAYYNNKSADRWLSVRLELIGSIVAGCAAFFATQVAISTTKSGNINSNFASLAGLSLTFAISLTGLLQWCVRSFAQLEAAMNSSERILYYSEEIPQEAPWTSEELEKKASGMDTSPSDPATYAVVASGGSPAKYDASWPSTGALTLNNLRMRYRPDTPLVLKGLNVSIAGGERIGVVGRTGSGKSSLLLTLLRLVEPDLDADSEKYEAPMTIDGIDTLRIGLRELRSKLGIIPQNPVLFSGTIRSNMDPFAQYSDDQIWNALEQCGLKASVEGMPGELGSTVAEYGSNLSAGMRQMLVMGRALLKQCRILLLDEATSSVDFETDKEIQRTLREAFKNTTVLTIAHRINTIMDSDKILVMKDGFVAEYAPPQELLKDENSIFSEIVRHAQSEEN